MSKDNSKKEGLSWIVENIHILLVIVVIISIEVYMHIFKNLSLDIISEFTLVVLVSMSIYLLGSNIKLEKKIAEINDNIANLKNIESYVRYIRDSLEHEKIEYFTDMKIHYRKAAELVENCVKCKATYFLRSCWLIKPESIIEEKWYDEYLKKIDEKLKKGILEFEWIISIESRDKFECLIEDLKQILKNSPEIIRKTNMMRVIEFKEEFNFPLINLQITTNPDGSKVLMIGVPKNNNTYLACGLKITDKPVIEQFEEIFQTWWNNSLPIVDGGEIYLENIRKLGSKYFNREELDKIVEELRDLCINKKIKFRG